MKKNADCRWLIVNWKLPIISHQQSKIINPLERGQSIALFAVLIPVTTIFVLLVMDWMVTNIRVMETIAATDLAAHAGAQHVLVLPDGSFEMETSAAQMTATSYFFAQAPNEAALGSVNCFLGPARPTCEVTASVVSAGYFLPQQTIYVHAVGYLAYGVTEEDQ